MGGDPGVLPPNPHKTFFRAGSESPGLHRKGQPDSQCAKNLCVLHPVALCGEVLGVLRNWIARNPIFPSSERRF